MSVTTSYQLATGWQIDRGRSYELDKTSTGTATIRFADENGRLDPTNSSSPLYGYVDPMRPAAIAIQNPVTLAWTTLYRGYVSNWEYELDLSEKVITGEVQCEDALGVLARYEVIPGQAGTTVPSGSEGNAYYAAQQVNDRIKAALADAQFPGTLTNIFSGNVSVQNTVYAPRTQILAVIQDAADGEFPGVSNVYISKDGILTFHGRYARFNPANASYGISHWKAGDMAAVTAGAGTVAPIASLGFSRDSERVYNAVIATPQNIASTDIAGQFVSDTASISTYGPRSLSFENLITNGGDETVPLNANAETKEFSTYYVNNYKDPRNRVNQVTFRPLPPTDPNAPYLWRVICGVEIGDLIDITTTHPGGGGFNNTFFVEGIHYDAQPLNNTYPDITLTLDLSPQEFYSNNPFST